MIEKLTVVANLSHSSLKVESNMWDIVKKITDRENIEFTNKYNPYSLPWERDSVEMLYQDGNFIVVGIKIKLLTFSGEGIIYKDNSYTVDNIEEVYNVIYARCNNIIRDIKTTIKSHSRIVGMMEKEIEV